MPIWLCAESSQCTDSFFGGEGNRIDVQTVRLAGNLRGDGENQIQGCVIACCLVLLLAFGAAEFDLFGYSRYLPERSAVQAAGLTHYQSNGLYTTQDDAFIQDVLNLHTAAVSEKSKQERAQREHKAQYSQHAEITPALSRGAYSI